MRWYSTPKKRINFIWTSSPFNILSRPLSFFSSSNETDTHKKVRGTYLNSNSCRWKLDFSSAKEFFCNTNVTYVQTTTEQKTRRRRPIKIKRIITTTVDTRNNFFFLDTNFGWNVHKNSMERQRQVLREQHREFLLSQFDFGGWFVVKLSTGQQHFVRFSSLISLFKHESETTVSFPLQYKLFSKDQNVHKCRHIKDRFQDNGFKKTRMEKKWKFQKQCKSSFF